MATYRELIAGSLRLIGVLGEGEQMQPYHAQNALATLNELVDALNSQSLKLYQRKYYTAALTGGSTYTVGPGGNVNVPVRPAGVAAAWFREGSGAEQFDLPVSVVTAGAWGGIRSKGAAGSPSGALFYDGNWPLATLTLHPGPDAGGTLVLLVNEPLDATVGLDDEESLPPAYRQALRFQLAVLLAPEFGREAPVTVQLTALKALTNISAANSVPELLRFELGRGWYDVGTDGVC